MEVATWCNRKINMVGLWALCHCHNILAAKNMYVVFTSISSIRRLIENEGFLNSYASCFPGMKACSVNQRSDKMSGRQ
jgi:hypothetical protein